MSLPSPIASSSSWSPRSIAAFFPLYISRERSLITSQIAFMRWIDSIGTRSRRSRRSHAGWMESAMVTNSRDHWMATSDGLRGWSTYVRKTVGRQVGRGKGAKCAHERFQGLREIVVHFLHERVERVPHHALSDQLQRSTPHPRQDVEVLRAVLDGALERRLELQRKGRRSARPVRQARVLWLRLSPTLFAVA